MSTNAIIEQLDRHIDAMLYGAPADSAHADAAEVAELTALAADLHQSPRPEFRRSLGAQLQAQAAALGTPLKPVLVRPHAGEDILPSLFHPVGAQQGDPRSFAMSLAAHACVLAVVLTSGMWMVKHKDELRTVQTTLIAPSEYVLPPAKTTLSGGGGGGDHSKLAASRGAAPKFNMEQITPPMIIRNESPKLAAEPSVVVPKINMQSPQLDLGDPMAHLSAPSNGVGVGAGMGSGSGGGVGSGNGPGVGEGYGGGIGGGVYRVGGGVSAPRAIYDPDPEYSEEARKAKYQGTVTLSLIVDQAGHPSNIHVVRSLGMGLDEKAVEAVKHWKFEPSMKDGHPVAVQVNLEVNFHMY